MRPTSHIISLKTKHIASEQGKKMDPQNLKRLLGSYYYRRFDRPLKRRGCEVMENEESKVD